MKATCAGVSLMTTPAEEIPAIRHVKIATIQRVVARHYNMSRSDLLSHRRMAELVRPRWVAIYLARTLTLYSLPGIGRHFGGRDHTTVLHAVRKIEAQLFEDAELAADVELLKRQLLELSPCSDQIDSDRALLERLRRAVESTTDPVVARDLKQIICDFFENDTTAGSEGVANGRVHSA